ncbi:MAG: hypothetical protein ACI9R3_001828 [Verrucomicrobiales bacterium]|jgi:hypothetical protein
MKSPRLASLVAALIAIPLLLLSTCLAADSTQSARHALKTLAQTKGADYLGRVVMVEGRYGNHQPKAWRILAIDPLMQGRLREFMIKGDQVDSERILIAWKQGQRVPLREVTIDSSDAFLQADLAAKDAEIGFDSLDYQLIMPTEAREPLWLVTLVSKDGDAVGEVHVGARSGVVSRKAWQKVDDTPVAQPANPKPAASAQSNRITALAPKPAATPARKPKKIAATHQTSRPASASAPVNLAVDAEAIKQTSGQILEGARQGIIRTSGSVRDFFKALQENP